MMAKTHALKLARIIVAALGAIAALISTMVFLTAARTQAAPLLGSGADPEIRLITMTADLPHHDPESSAGITKTVYFSNSVSGVITMTFDISGTQTLTLTTGVAFDRDHTYTSAQQSWTPSITYSVAATHTTQPHVIYTTTNAGGIATTVVITYVQDITAPASSIVHPPAGYIGGTQLVITGTASDIISNVAGSGISITQISTNTGATWNNTVGATSWAYTWTLPAADNIPYTLSVRAQDNLGAWQQVLPTVTITVDNVPPTGVAITAPAHISATQFAVSWSASGAVSYTVAYSRTGDTDWRDWLTDTTITSETFPAQTTETEYMFQVTAYDLAGNPAKATTATWVGPFRIYLPLILRQWVAWHQYDTYEPNNSREEAHGPLSSGQSYYSHIYNESDQRDYYYLTPASSGSIVVDLTIPVCCDYDLYLYDSLTGNFVAASNYMGKGLDEQMTYSSAQAGATYYVLVYSPYQDHSNQNQYQLRATFP